MLAFCGWGYALVRWTPGREDNSFAYLSIVGIAILTFLGGVLNLVRLAYPMALGTLLLIGLAFFIIYCSDNAKVWITNWRANDAIDAQAPKASSWRFLPIGILFIAVGFYAFMLLPSHVFNISDDFYTYLPRPLRMLQTGTLAGNPFDVLGKDTMGAQAFLQGFVLLGFPIEYLMGIDTVFSFALAGLLLIAIGKRIGLHWIYTVFALLAFLVINPQTVNISVVYLGSAMILGVLLASYHLLDQLEDKNGNQIPISTAVMLGFLLASLIALKGTFISYALAYFAFFLTGMLIVSTDKPRVLRLCGFVVLGAFVALLPWILLLGPHYVSVVQKALLPTANAAVNHFSIIRGNPSALFSSANLLYGNSFLSYGIIVLILAAAGVYSLFSIIGNKVSPTQRGYLIIAAASCTAGVISYFFFGLIFFAQQAVRYSCPILIATLPFACMAASRTIPISWDASTIISPPGIKFSAMLMIPLIVIVPFWGNFTDRVERAYDQHMTLSFPVMDDYINYSRNAISAKAQHKIREIQYKTAPAQKILAWIPTPMHLDFSRNEIYSVMSSGLSTSWLDMPINNNTEEVVQYLKGQGIRYILWQYNENDALEITYRRWMNSPIRGYREAAERGLYLRSMLASIMDGGDFLYRENGMMLFDLKQLEK